MQKCKCDRSHYVTDLSKNDCHCNNVDPSCKINQMKDSSRPNTCITFLWVFHRVPELHKHSQLKTTKYRYLQTSIFIKISGLIGSVKCNIYPDCWVPTDIRLFGRHNAYHVTGTKLLHKLQAKNIQKVGVLMTTEIPTFS